MPITYFESWRRVFAFNAALSRSSHFAKRAEELGAANPVPNAHELWQSKACLVECVVCRPRAVWKKARRLCDRKAGTERGLASQTDASPPSSPSQCLNQLSSLASNANEKRPNNTTFESVGAVYKRAVSDANEWTGL
ncbi:hypothetical protein PPROV_000840400 [Pycnococcus provasolii]|uniref:Uncharacterized protein n=1 Tax=Pycnococcus provasolii TaxID=41880 RepID=A0A830HXM6_9CHLO|nr:hypothetical protein PPROV_000840400 [Pycnococcus provasolii]